MEDAAIIATSARWPGSQKTKPSSSCRNSSGIKRETVDQFGERRIKRDAE
jgi:hypothetical protein